MRAIVSKLNGRLIPILLLMYVMAFLNRTNLGFAKQAFEADTGIGESAFAFAASIFFISYALLEVPSNLMLHRVGARAWLGRIMVSWGIISALFLFQFGTGPIKGFAVTLLIGLAASVFTAFFVSRLIFDVIYRPTDRHQAISI